MTERAGKEEILILVVDDDESIRRYLMTLLSSEGYRSTSAARGEEALHLIRRGLVPSLIILDMMMPQMDGIEVLRKIRELDKTLPVVVLSAAGQTGAIVQAMRMGATDYLTKPFEEKELFIIIERAIEGSRAKPGGPPPPPDPKDDFISAGDEMMRIKEMIKKTADHDAAVLILGESGVGKELIARSLHDQSSRRRKAMVRVNCAAIPSELLESELFGYERGAFTGALNARIGKFEMAEGGTIFLDEIGEMSPGLQAKLLHVLQDGTFSKLGSAGEQKVDARVVAATNQNLERAIKEKRFRGDLYYRLNVIKIVVPPLRERKEEIPLLTRHFFKKFKERYHSGLQRIPEPLMEAFMSYSWPGNIRELENMVRRYIAFGDEKYLFKELGLAAPAAYVLQTQESAVKTRSLKAMSKNNTAQVERDIILRVLTENRWNKKRTSAALNISPRSLYYKIKKYGLGGSGSGTER